MSISGSSCRTGKEFSAAWENLQIECSGCANFLSTKPRAPLIISAARAGEGKVDSSTRHQILEQREGLRSLLLLKSLELHTDQSARPVWVFPQTDKLSFPWLLSLSLDLRQA